MTFLAPGEGDAVPRRLSLSPATEVYYFNVVVSYEGVEEGKKYWVEVRKAFRVLNKNLFVEIDSRGNWDRNKTFNPPELLVPDFKLKVGGSRGPLASNREPRTLNRAPRGLCDRRS